MYSAGDEQNGLLQLSSSIIIIIIIAVVVRVCILYIVFVRSIDFDCFVSGLLLRKTPFKRQKPPPPPHTHDRRVPVRLHKIIQFKTNNILLYALAI